MTNLATDVGADAPASYALERSAPADTPAYLSTHDAAAVLRKLRQPKANDTDMPDPSARAPTAAPETGHSGSLRAFTPVFDGLRTRVNALMESTAADAADDAAPGPRVKPGDAQDPGERTEGADRQQEPAPIEPPRSWTKEDKELFTSLPRATQERIAERERSRESDFLRRQNEAAEKLKGLTAKEQAVELARQTYETALPQLLQTLQQQQAGEFADIKSMADVERLAREDWPRYLLWDLQQKKIAEVGQHMLAAQHRQAQEKLTQFAEFAKRADDLFKEKVPDMADEAKAAELQKQALAVLGDLGFTEAELLPLWNGHKELSLRDHRLQLLIRDATLWREAEKKAKAAATKPVPPVQRPGAA
ncbi:MAG TPA: hypothetical protein VFO15_12070, partial [Xanthobacteraceae bacterium]|nr:hypothetical protein [Xanthobacteraceae bacterium]